MVTGKVVYVLFLILSTIVAPITSLPLWPVALFTYGYRTAVLLTFFGNVSGAMVNFLLARKFGRPLVEKLVGGKGIKEIDKFTDVVGWKAFLWLRILGNISFDVISYAMGLTNIRILVYFLITFATSLLWTGLVFLFLKTAFSLGKLPSILLISLGYLLSLYGGIRVWRRHIDHKL